MQKLQKINTRLEKNAEDWKIKHYNCQQQLILLTESNLKQTEKNQKLEKLCRALQVKFLYLTVCIVFFQTAIDPIVLRRDSQTPRNQMMD